MNWLDPDEIVVGQKVVSDFREAPASQNDLIGAACALIGFEPHDLLAVRMWEDLANDLIVIECNASNGWLPRYEIHGPEVRQMPDYERLILHSVMGWAPDELEEQSLYVGIDFGSDDIMEFNVWQSRQPVRRVSGFARGGVVNRGAGTLVTDGTEICASPDSEGNVAPARFVGLGYTTEDGVSVRDGHLLTPNEARAQMQQTAGEIERATDSLERTSRHMAAARASFSRVFNRVKLYTDGTY